MWIWDQFFSFLGISTCALYAMYCHSPDGDTAAALEDKAFNIINVQSSEDTAAALAEFALCY